MAELSADYVVVGAGSSGATLAARLAEAGAGTVILLEAGDQRDKDFWVKTPIGIAKILQNPDYVWPSMTTPQRHLDGQEIYLPMGRMLGGSSSVNGMIYVRGDPAEFDHWRELGCDGWGYEDILPYYKRQEDFPGGDPAVRGQGGPVGITSLAGDLDPLTSAWLEACRQAGIPLTADYNGALSSGANSGGYEGAGSLQLSTRRGQRCGTARAYLDRVRENSNLRIETGARAERILFDGRRAIGVAFLQKGDRHVVHATREVVLSAGPIRSPQLLELSGIGQPAVLKAQGITPIHALSGVGENFIDHLQSRITFEGREIETLNTILDSRIKTLAMGAKYLVTRRGLMATPSATAHANVRTEREARPAVKIQIHHLSGADRYANTKGAGLDPFPGFGVGFFQLRPNSRGSVHIESNDPTADPSIDPNYLAEESDQSDMLEALNIARRVMAQPAISPLVVRETRPGPDIVDASGLLEYIKKSGQTSWHPVGTCKMGCDEKSVVTPDLLVRGFENLRVADSSVMPTMPSSNTNAPSIMIGEKASDLILDRRP